MTLSTKKDPPRSFSRFTASKRERLSTGHGEGAVVLPASRLRHRAPAGNRGRGGLTRANAVGRRK